jgi:hypothetical protein
LAGALGHSRNVSISFQELKKYGTARRKLKGEKIGENSRERGRVRGEGTSKRKQAASSKQQAANSKSSEDLVGHKFFRFCSVDGMTTKPLSQKEKR